METRVTILPPNREQNLDIGYAKRAVQDGPAAIAGQGKPPHMLMTYDEFRRLAGRRSLVEALAMPGLSDIDFDPPRVEIAARGIYLS